MLTNTAPGVQLLSGKPPEAAQPVVLVRWFNRSGADAAGHWRWGLASGCKMTLVQPPRQIDSKHITM
jgi:hypothetical protein